MQTNDGSVNYKSEAAAIAFLDHTRTMLIHTAGLRVKNFNFFLVFAGIIVAAFTKIGDPQILRIIAGIGLMLSAVFYILDVRNFQQIRDIRDDLEKIEPKFGISIHTVDQVPDPSRGKKGANRFHFVISHTFGFRAIFVLNALLCLWVVTKGADYISSILSNT